MKNIISFKIVLCTVFILCATAFTCGVRELYGEGRIVSVTNVKVWLKEHPEVDPNTMQRKDGQTTSVVKVTTIKEWLKAHPNIDPKNIKNFNPPANPTGLLSLTPTLTWKNPPNTVYSSILVVKKDSVGQTVLEANNVQGESFTIPKDNLEFSTEYVWQIGHVKKSSEIADGGTFKFITNKPPAPKLKAK